ncbi:hypothetical protein BD309DRAFT_997374 [Dichomitus squalens]|uniref:Uncharacterized protein n=1 Tax=Dichomitus squalens TaxID=114155 RepID=A0A4Q9PUE7_9APHY|nr:hypothetical protein BD309DRAFT_997374 [Dichomitus squalens]TBU57964.1 hypothetical protein BD310DRAFT_977687 [Dichomitus squalens]
MAPRSVILDRNFMNKYDRNLVASLAVAENEEQLINQDKRIIVKTCTYCKRMAPVTLRSCKLCKAARYCDEQCQRADYRTNHRRVCAEFVNPPRTRAFRTHLIGPEEYAHSPIFAQGDKDGLGVWISTGNKVGCEAQKLSKNLVPLKNGDPGYTARVNTILDQPKELHRASKQDLTTLHVCLQNRRKDGVPILVFGAGTQLVTYASSTRVALRGQVDSQDNITTFIRNGNELAAIGVVKDPWTQAPRVHVVHINGKSANLPPYPSVLKDPTEAIVALHPGDYAVMSLQFRTGDGKTITKDWQAFKLLDHVIIPFMKWDGTSRPETLASSLPPAYTLPDISASKTLKAKYVVASFNQSAIWKHYWDAIKHGDDVFLRTHNGDVHAAMNSSMTRAQEALTEATLRLVDLPESERNEEWCDKMKSSLAGLL